MSIAEENTPFTLGDWRVEPELNRIVRGEEIVKIDPRNMKVLQLLASRPGQVIAQSEIETTVWSDVIVTPNSVYQSVAQLRRALGDDKSNPRYIETISRKGYRLVGRVVSIEEQIQARDVPVPIAAAVANKRLSRTRLAIGLAATAIAVFTVALGLMYFRGDSKPLRLAEANTRQTVGSDFTTDPLLAVEGDREPKALRAQLLIEMGDAALIKGRRNEALAHFKQALQLHTEMYGDGHPRVGPVLSMLANAFVWNEDYLQAESTARAAIQAFASLSELNPDRIDAIHRLGEVLIERENLQEARQHLEYSLALSRIVNGDLSLKTLDIQISLSTMLFAGRDLENAEKLAKEAVETQAKLRGDQHTGAQYRTLWAAILLEQHRHREAQNQAQVALDILISDSRSDHPYIASAQEVLARSLLKSGEYARAEVLVRDAMKIWQRNDGWSQRVANAASLLGEILVAQGRIADAEKYLAYASRRLIEARGGRARRMQALHAERLQLLQLAKAEQARPTKDVAELAGL
jgi:DNA-binding winged helix-turn-helix (wHTH) protein